MFGNNDRDKALSLAEAELLYWQGEVESRRAAADKAELELSQTERKLGTAEAFMEILRERYGLQAVATPSMRFERLALREAALIVIEEKGSITPQQLVAELQAGGFQFGNHPLRRLHAALLHQKRAIKDQSGAWRWTAPDQAQFPLIAEGKEASDQK